MNTTFPVIPGLTRDPDAFSALRPTATSGTPDQVRGDEFKEFKT